MIILAQLIDFGENQLANGWTAPCEGDGHTRGASTFIHGGECLCQQENDSEVSNLWVRTLSGSAPRRGEATSQDWLGNDNILEIPRAGTFFLF
jgi:hypothetical protein